MKHFRRRLQSTRQSPNLRHGAVFGLVLAFLAAAIATALVAWVLVSIFDHKQEARKPFVRVAEVTEISTDPKPWGLNWPHHFDGWKSTAGDKFYGGSSALPPSKLESQPWLKRLYAGYAFSIDYREARGHAYMLYDQGVTERVTKKPQAGACLHCHESPYASQLAKRLLVQVAAIRPRLTVQTTSYGLKKLPCRRSGKRRPNRC